MPLDMDEALDQYGFVGLLAKQEPKLRGLLTQATKEGWNSARFERELADTKWYKARSERLRAIALQKATDPATWKATLGNKVTEVRSLASRMGVQINYDLWAQRALENDWDEGALRAVLFSQHNPKVTGGGEAVEIEAQLRETYTNYGMPMTQAKLNSLREQVQAGRNTIGGVQQQVINAAKKHYSQFAEEIDSGMTLREIADPYVQTMANTLEITPTNIGLSDKYIKQALSAKGADGKPTTMTLTDFERNLKNDARWQHTKQAKDETYAILQQVGNDWGFL